MAKRTRKQSDILPSMQLNTVLAWNGNLKDAVRVVGYKDPKSALYKLRKNPKFTDQLKRKQDSMIKASGEMLGRKLTICRTDIIDHLWRLARMSAEDTGKNIYGQIKATEALAHIFDIHIVRDADLKREIEQHTEQQIDFFVEHGYFPSPEEEEEYAKGNQQGKDGKKEQERERA